MVVAVKDHGVSLQPIAADAADEAEREAHLWNRLDPFTPRDEEQCSLTSREGAAGHLPSRSCLALCWHRKVAPENYFS